MGGYGLYTCALR